MDATTGLVTAMGAGKATIIATRTQDELYTVYGLPYQLKYDFVVIMDLASVQRVQLLILVIRLI